MEQVLQLAVIDALHTLDDISAAHRALEASGVFEKREV
jgi:hypothetical protein